MTEQEASLSVLLSATADVVDDFAREPRESRDEVLQLRTAMEAHATIEQARGMLMMRYGLSAEKALHFMLRSSRSHQVELRVLAVALVNLGLYQGHGTSRQPTQPGPSRAPDASSVGPVDATDAPER